MKLPSLVLVHLILSLQSASPADAPASLPPVTVNTIQEIQRQIQAVQNAGHPRYQPQFVYVVDPSTQRLHVLSGDSFEVKLTLPAGTGAKGVGFADGQTPPGFYTMGGVRIAKDASASIQTGDSRPGVSGIYAELLYPPQFPDKAKRGKVPINVVIHSFNPKVSEALRRRYEDGLIGKEPCTTGCPVVHPNDASKLAPFLKESSGSFDPSTRAGTKLAELIRKKLVVEYSHRFRLGDPIYIVEPVKPAS